MANLAKYAGGLFVALAVSLVGPMSLKADPIIISVTAPPGLSTLIDSSSIVSTSWSEAGSYTEVSIAALVDSAIVGQTPTADAYLTTQIGPGTTTADEIAHSQFTVPVNLPICSPSSCGAMVTLFSGLSLGPGNYFLTMGPDPISIGVVGWFPALNPSVLLDTGVSEGNSFFASAMASYPPASDFGVSPFAMNFVVTGTPTSAIPEPSTATLVAFGTFFLLIIRRALASHHHRGTVGLVRGVRQDERPRQQYDHLGHLKSQFSLFGGGRLASADMLPQRNARLATDLRGARNRCLSSKRSLARSKAQPILKSRASR